MSPSRMSVSASSLQALLLNVARSFRPREVMLARIKPRQPSANEGVRGRDGQGAEPGEIAFLQQSIRESTVRHVKVQCSRGVCRRGSRHDHPDRLKCRDREPSPRVFRSGRIRLFGLQQSPAATASACTSSRGRLLPHMVTPRLSGSGRCHAASYIAHFDHLSSITSERYALKEPGGTFLVGQSPEAFPRAHWGRDQGPIPFRRARRS